MAYEQKDNSGSLFRENEKKSDRSPDYTGKAMIDGKMKRIAGWINPQPAREEAPPQSVNKPVSDIGDIPF